MLRLSKTELKRQKDVLKRYKRYLPMLQLKQQLLQKSIQQVQAEWERVEKELASFMSSMSSWIAVFSDNINLHDITQLKDVIIGRGNIAGVDIPVYQSCSFTTEPYDIFTTPVWLDAGIVSTQEIVELKVHMNILGEQINLLTDEFRRTTQRVNLFEKILIPDTLNNIRTIQIALSDQQTAAVVRGKICKRKILEKSK